MCPSEPDRNVANSSGFPLQIAVEHLVRTSGVAHGWKVAQVEHAWRDREEGQDGFIDLILRDKGSSTLVVECKRVRDTAWVFLPADGDPALRSAVTGWVTSYRGGTFTTLDWRSLHAKPLSPRAGFCVVRGQGDQRPMLERGASEVIMATEALAHDERDAHGEYRPVRFYFGVIVTTAELRVARFDPSSASLALGELDNAQFETVPFVRFHKQLLARHAPVSGGYLDDEKIAGERERTVFIVNSQHLESFLKDFELDNQSIRRHL